MKVRAVIGKNFGDEGKGLAVDFFAHEAEKNGEKCLVVRHNGGGQAGHTVETGDKRFIFHQLSSGSFRDADTLWSETYMPDLYKLGEETDEFQALSHKSPLIFADKNCRCTYIDDVLINMGLEVSRGDSRHGSCGMGINECVQRSLSYPLLLGKVKGMTASELSVELKRIRHEYLPQRLDELSADLEDFGEYGLLLKEDSILDNAAERMVSNADKVELFSYDRLNDYGSIIFEGAQGLLLDEFYLKYEPHLTTSRTGSINPAEFCRRYLSGEELELIYITRSYVTRHGNGPLPYEGRFDPKAYGIVDLTNMPNEWQGALRFAPHGDTDIFIEPVKDDLLNTQGIKTKVSLMITHLNETGGNICMNAGEIPVNDFISKPEISDIFKTFYLSYSRRAQRAQRDAAP